MLFGVYIMPFNQFLGLMMLICIVLSIMARKWLNNNPVVKSKLNDAAKSKLIDLISKHLK